MSFDGADDHPKPIGPEDGYYAPRAERGKAEPTIQRGPADELGPFASRSPYVSF